MVRRILLLALAGLVVYLLWLPWVPDVIQHNPSRIALADLRIEQARRKGRHLKIQQTWRPLSEISPFLIHAIILSEDDTFYQHHGFDWQQIQIAFQTDWQKKRFAYGGSTITQQLARTLYLSPRKNVLRKIKEALLTLWMEHVLSKKRILELYVNVIEWGPGIFGADAAAQHYFSVSAAQLDPDQAASLASILPSPRRWSPLSEKTFMARRRTNLLERMGKAGYIPASDDEEEEPDISTGTLERVSPLDLQPETSTDTVPEPLMPGTTTENDEAHHVD